MFKKKNKPFVPELNLNGNKKSNLVEYSSPPNSEEDRLPPRTPTPEPTISNYICLDKSVKLNLDYIESLGENNLKIYFEHNTKYSQLIFCGAVEQNKKKLVTNILKIKDNLINVKTLPEKYNILHIALLGVAGAKMEKILLQNKPKLIAEEDKEKLTPLMFGDKYGFGKAVSETKTEKMRKILVEYEKNVNIHEPHSRDLTIVKSVDYNENVLKYSSYLDNGHNIELSGDVYKLGGINE